MKKPVIISLGSRSLKDIQTEYSVSRTVDTYKDQLEDLFLIRNPRYRFNKNYKEDFENFLSGRHQEDSMERYGKWVYFPWNNILAHYLDDQEHQEVRTARNKNFITDAEQQKFYNFSVGIAGLSVGSHGATALALMGGGRKIKLADPDTISPTNLNRMRFDFLDIGGNKAESIAEYIYQLNPYADITIYKDGITEENMEEFMDGLDILVEELDDIEMKFSIRKEAKKRRIPVVMATDNGDSVIMDIERFDLDPDLHPFHGKLDDFDPGEIKKSPQKMFQAMARIIDISLVPPRILHSVTEVGKTIYSWPQMASAAMLSGVIIAYAIRKIALGEDIRSGKTEINVDAALDPSHEKNKDIRAKESEDFLKTLS